MKQLVLVGILAGAVAAGSAFAQGQQPPAGQAEKGQATPAPKVKTARPAGARAQAASSLGTIRLKHNVMANGQPLKAGTYQVRLTDEEVKTPTGEVSQTEKWVEFLQGGKVRGKEIASVIPDTDIKSLQREDKILVPKGQTRVDELKGKDYVRVWINRGGNNYLIHLPPATA